MTIRKEIDMTVDINLEDKDLCEWMEERIASTDLLFNDEGKEKMKAIKGEYYVKWMEIYWFFQNPSLALHGIDCVPEGCREDYKRYFS